MIGWGTAAAPGLVLRAGLAAGAVDRAVHAGVNGWRLAQGGGGANPDGGNGTWIERSSREIQRLLKSLSQSAAPSSPGAPTRDGGGRDGVKPGPRTAAPASPTAGDGAGAPSGFGRSFDSTSAAAQDWLARANADLQHEIMARLSVPTPRSLGELEKPAPKDAPATAPSPVAEATPRRDMAPPPTAQPMDQPGAPAPAPERVTPPAAATPPAATADDTASREAKERLEKEGEDKIRQDKDREAVRQAEAANRAELATRQEQAKREADQRAEQTRLDDLKRDEDARLAALRRADAEKSRRLAETQRARAVQKAAQPTAQPSAQPADRPPARPDPVSGRDTGAATANGDVAKVPDDARRSTELRPAQPRPLVAEAAKPTPQSRMPKEDLVAERKIIADVIEEAVTAGSERSSGHVSRHCPAAGRRVHPPARYTVGRGDTLWRIAARHYRHGRRYPVIVRANPSQIPDPDRIYPCQRFLIPVWPRRH